MMTYKTVLVHIDDTPASTVRSRIAAMLAQQFDSHLVATALTGLSHYIFEASHIAMGDPNIAHHLTLLRQRAERAVTQFQLEMQGVELLSIESGISNDDANGGMGLRARYADLLIIGQTDRNQLSPSVMSDFPEYMLVHSGRPVLIIPHTGSFDQIGKKVLLAWDASRESTRALMDALPLLKRSELVHVLIVNPAQEPERHGQEPGTDIALFLARHGVKVEVCTRDSSHEVGEIILKTAGKKSCDLIVMGAYGHSRFREMIMGGVSRTILEKMHIPVLMSH
ncbi:MAG: universal stress protein [Undibacterium sp.]|nr:universal stress protein [Undibacterium sp.]